MMHAASTEAAHQRPGGVPLPADVIAVLADQHVEVLDVDVVARLQSGRGEVLKRNQSGLGGVGGSDSDLLPAEIVELADRAIVLDRR